MSLEQLHYTSAAPGDEGASGRFTSVGSGIPAALLTEIEPYLGYELPGEAPYLPTDDELRSLPQSFSCTALSDGSRLVCRTVPVRGTGSAPVRFHAHAVHLPAGARLPGDRQPIEAWRSPRWVSVTPGGAIPDPLSALPPGPGAVREGLGDFAVSRTPWLAAVFSDLRRVSEEGPGSPPVVLVERQSADIARWVALAGAALPSESAEQLTFTTYTRRPGAAPHRVVGVLPQDARALGDDGFRVHTCSGSRPPVVTDDAWAETAARIWRSRAPELFREASELPGEPFAAGPPAVIALCAGIALGPNERAAAADWTAERPYALDAGRTRQLVEALTAPEVDGRTGPEFDAVGRLFGALDGRAPVSTTAPLAAMLVTEAVRGGNGSLELPRRAAFAGPEGEAIATTLGPEILAELSAAGTGTGGDVARTVQLLRVARLLDVDCAELLPTVVRRLAPALLTDEGAQEFAPTLLELLDEQFDVRTALLGALDRIAPDDPGAVERLLERVALPFTGSQALPHLRMCAEAGGARATLGGDRAAVWHRVLRAAGMSPFAEPLVLRTAVGLVWGDRAPTVGEARLLLDAATSDSHRTAGTWSCLVDAALGAPADEEDAAAFAYDLLRGFPQEIGGRVRGALLLLDFAREIRSGTAEPGWAERARSLCALAEPVEPAVRDRAFGALTEQLLAPDRPEAELYAFVHSDDGDLVAAYDRAARAEAVGRRLRSEPAYAADCFNVWTSYPHAGRSWTTTASALLNDVLRPAVRAQSPADVARIEAAVGHAGSSGRADAFRDWNRSSTLGRLGRRIAGRVRRG
ncbi:GTPase-associated protein 1-related protein [Streptomyces sp. NBC_01237]|uniref:GTPase-associated protein 1-related protein n=1 Tax=Streptomyces sp. NBC_01237 TaxID=2903790 RepID=UPI002DDA4CAB|nr:GTPase-associated protein 1-related protein [Streptomyces sp. NBC_01237]WRZ75827.1 GTPase-associated protein 1-related protein [Streptomyces sp. NBC_01237]